MRDELPLMAAFRSIVALYIGTLPALALPGYGLGRQEKAEPIITAVIGSIGNADAFLQKSTSGSKSSFVHEIVTFQDLNGFQRFGHKCDGPEGVDGSTSTPRPEADLALPQVEQELEAALESPMTASALLFLQVNETQAPERRNESGSAAQQEKDSLAVVSLEKGGAQASSGRSDEEQLGEVFPETASAGGAGKSSADAVHAAVEAAKESAALAKAAASAATAAKQLAFQELVPPATEGVRQETDFPTPVPTPSLSSNAPQIVLRDSVDLQDGQSSASVLAFTPEPLRQGSLGFFERHTGIMYMFLGAIVTTAFGSACVLIAAAVFPDIHVVTSRAAADVLATTTAVRKASKNAAAPPPEPPSQDEDDGLRNWVESLPVCCAADVEDRLPSSTGYDCHLSRPRSSKGIVRLEGRVEAVSCGATPLTAPLSKQACVIYSTAVSRKSHGNIVMHPVAFAAASADFVITLADDSNVQVHLEAEDVSMFDMCLGRHTASLAFSNAPDHWQDFVLTHRTGAAGVEFRSSSALQSDSSSLEFQECGLLIGALVTLVGELHRSADGVLSLRPYQARPCGDPWSVSWERTACTRLDASAATKGLCDGPACNNMNRGGVPAAAAKVLISDDALLVNAASQQPQLPLAAIASLAPSWPMSSTLHSVSDRFQ
eukprot:TRINITY_DN74158_c0_g1_i1.p1 TRINITY_DN74158_c0_g1~~TRINITY_DN74158_c0_g1_i1.p1  ORF type:complete len:661 (-),score=139.77 TRINITY_DN74158_c0_g1_i1:45-2027(-)